MSGIDLTNPQVLRNFIIGQIKEGNGNFIEKKDVVIFKTFAGDEYVVPEGVEVPKKQKEPKAEKVGVEVPKKQKT